MTISSETRVSRMVKITKLPPAPQTVFFQEHQFDEELTGADPHHYERSGSLERHQSLTRPYSGTDSDGRGTKTKRKMLKKAKKALIGHENAAEILKILRAE